MEYEELNYVSPDGLSYKDEKDYVWIKVLGFCGCYSVSLYEITFKILYNLYKSYLLENYESPFEYKDKSKEFMDLQELILSIFYSKNLIDHGTSVRFGWLNENGANICKIIWPEETKK